MLSIADNELLSRVGAGTPMGDLMRRYWHPIAAAAELDENPFRTKEVKLLGEELVLYRDRSGQLGLLDRYCTHRRASLAYGIVENDGVRCQYHGWKFDEQGEVIDQPFEDTVHPDQRFRAKCAIQAYKAEERAGLVFAYMGPEPAPLLPNWAPLVWDNAVRDIAIAELPCNWLQCQENSLDPVHVEWLHSYFGDYVRSMQGGVPPAETPIPARKHQKIAFDEFEYGIIKRRVLEGFTEQDDDWAVGHPILFPHILMVGNQFAVTMQWRVPVDDEHTYHVSLYSWKTAPGYEPPVQETVPYRHVDLQDAQGRFRVDLVFNQDYMAWITQGSIAKRDVEKLGESDRGVILFRKMLKDQVELMQEKGGWPTVNIFRDPIKNAILEPPVEPIKFGNRHAPLRYVPGEAGYSRDADKIQEVLNTWNNQNREAVRA